MEPILFCDNNCRVKGIHTWKGDFTPEMLENGTIGDITATQYSRLFRKENGDYFLAWGDNRTKLLHDMHNCSFIEFSELI